MLSKDMTINCKKCGNGNDADANFCVYCGGKLPAPLSAATESKRPEPKLPTNKFSMGFAAAVQPKISEVPNLQLKPQVPKLTLLASFGELWGQSRFWRMLVIVLGVLVVLITITALPDGEGTNSFVFADGGTCQGTNFANQGQTYKIATAARTSTSSLEELKCMSDSGNAWAQADLGELYDIGAGVQKNSTKALSLYRRSAAQDNAAGEAHLARIYYWGHGVTQDYGKAAKYSMKSALQGNWGGELLLGYAYDFGNGVPQDSNTAAVWYRKAADQGSADAQNNLGRLYFYGRGVPHSKIAALYWWKLSAAQGNATAIKNISGIDGGAH